MDTKELAYFIRRNVLLMTSNGKSSHIGSCLSIADILAVLYNSVLKYDLKNHSSKKKDYFILSKGHAGAALYATLAGVGLLKQNILKSHYQNGSILSGHVSHHAHPLIEFSTGSLGHGLPVSTGIAYGFKIDKIKSKSYCLLSDGELDEGSNWEAIAFAAHHKLNNLTALIDYNKYQSLDTVENTLNLEPLNKKFESFNWHVIEVDGHNHEELLHALTLSTKIPKVIICHTTKGKGVDFMENKVLWHYRSPQGDELKEALELLNEKYCS